MTDRRRKHREVRHREEPDDAKRHQQGHQRPEHEGERPTVRIETPPAKESVEASPGTQRERDVEHGTERMRRERALELTVQERGKAGCQPAARTRALEHDHARAGRESELRVGPMPIGAWGKQEPDDGHEQPGKKPEQVSAELVSGPIGIKLNQFRAPQRR